VVNPGHSHRAREAEVGDRPVSLGAYYTRGVRFHQLAKAIEKESPSTLLCIGCGNGYLESLLSPSIRIESIDLNEEELAKARALNAKLVNRNFQKLDVFDVPRAFAPESFSAVVMSEVIEHLPDDNRALEIAGRCLPPSGTIFLTVPNIQRFSNWVRAKAGRQPIYMAVDHAREYTLKDSQELVSKTGFRCVSVAGLDFRLPKEITAFRVVPGGNAVRQWLARRYPTMATWYLLVCKKA
jgi:SAM-dependent methyltransferase